MRHLLLASAGALLLAGCFRDADPIDVDATPLQVHAVLHAGADSATVLLSRPAADRGSYVPVSGADVRIASGGVAVQLAEHEDGAACVYSGHAAIGGGVGCYSAPLPQPVQAGALYDLEILTVGDVRITGSTRVPQALELLAPAPGTAYAIECPPIDQTGSICRSLQQGSGVLAPLAVLELTWTPPVEEVRTDAVFRVDRVMKDDVPYAGDICQVEPSTLFRPVESPRGSVRWPVVMIYCTGPFDVVPWDTIHLEATAAVYDDAYSEYTDAVLDGDAARLDAVSAGLNGAIGVFGSVNATMREIVLVRVEAQ